MNKIIFIISLIVLNNSYACENNNFKTDRDDIANLIAKSYTQSIKNSNENLNYHHLY